MANGIDPAILAQFQQNGWTPPQSATAVNMSPAPMPPAPAPLQASGDVYNSPQMQSLLAPPTPLKATTLGPRGKKEGQFSAMAQDTAAADEGGSAGVVPANNPSGQAAI